MPLRPHAAGLVRRYRRQITFGVVGVTVMAFGFLALIVLVEGLGVSPHLAYLVQAVLSVELSFVLSRHWTWRDRRGRAALTAAGEWLRFHASRAFSIPANQALFSTLVFAGASVLSANAVCVTATALVNYLVSHHLIFREGAG